MTRLPRHVKACLVTLQQAEESGPSRSAAADLLTLALRLDGLSRALEAYREGARSLGLLDEARRGQDIYDAWLRLSRYFLAPLAAELELLQPAAASPEEAPAGLEALGACWDRIAPELQAFLAEVEQLDRSLAEAPPGAHLGYRFRSRLLSLDRRAERAKVATDLLRRGLLEAMRSRLEGEAARTSPGGPP